MKLDRVNLSPDCNILMRSRSPTFSHHTHTGTLSTKFVAGKSSAKTVFTCSAFTAPKPEVVSRPRIFEFTCSRMVMAGKYANESVVGGGEISNAWEAKRDGVAGRYV